MAAPPASYSVRCGPNPVADDDDILAAITRANDSLWAVGHFKDGLAQLLEGARRGPEDDSRPEHALSTRDGGFDHAPVSVADEQREKPTRGEQTRSAGSSAGISTWPWSARNPAERRRP